MVETKCPEKSLSQDVTDSKTRIGNEGVVGTVEDIRAGSQALHRKLRGKEVQLFAIGGAIGTCKAVISHIVRRS